MHSLCFLVAAKNNKQLAFTLLQEALLPFPRFVQFSEQLIDFDKTIGIDLNFIF